MLRIIKKEGLVIIGTGKELLECLKDAQKEHKYLKDFLEDYTNKLLQ